MKLQTAILSLFLVALPALAEPIINTPQVANVRDCFGGVFTSYDSWRAVMKQKYQRKAKTEKELNKRLKWFDSRFGKAKFAEYKDSLACQVFSYQVEDKTVQGYVIKPKQATQKKLPVLIYNRGGNGSFGRVVFGSMMNNLFPIASEGFVIIGSQYRGTHSKSDALDQFGGEDVKDVTALVDLIPSIAQADVNRVGMYGASRGGMQTHLAVQQLDNIKAIATIAGASDLAMGLTIRPAMERVYQKRIPNYAQNKQTELAKRSVLNWVEDLSPNIPILLIHGDRDKRVSAKHSEVLARALDESDIPHKLLLIPGEDHFLLKSRKLVNSELVTWFKQYL